MRLSKAEKDKIIQALERAYPGFIVDSNAPTGQNNFCHNFLLRGEGNTFLVKVIIKSSITNIASKAQVLSELDSLKALRSHYVVKLLDTKDLHNYSFLRFPFLNGKNLEQVMSEKSLFSEDEIINVATGVLRGIIDISKKGIVHQDLKPGNIFLTDSGDIVILDFGSARYRQSPFKGNARSNYGFCSPEQIIANRTKDLQLLRKVLDNRSDVYALGIILYKLATGKHPFESGDSPFPAENILDKQVILPIERADISEQLQSIIFRMLTWETKSRPMASKVLAYLEGDESVEKPIIKKGSLFYNASNGASRFFEVNKEDSLFDGIIIDASSISLDRSTRLEILQKSSEVLIDPQCYLIQSSHLSQKLKKLSYHVELGSLVIAPDTAEKVRNGDFDNLIELILEAQINYGVSALTLPFLYIQEFNDDSWTIDQELTLRALKIVNQKKYSLPLVKGVSFSQAILESDSKNNLLEYLTSSYLEEISSFMVLIESNPEEVIISQSWLEHAKKFFTELCLYEKTVIWSKADLSGLVMPVPGISIALGEFQSQRKFNIKNEQTGGRRGKFYYVSELFARIKWTDALTAVSSYPKISSFYCSDKCCSSVNFSSPAPREEKDLMVHMLFKLALKFKLYSGIGGRVKAKADIVKAQKHYEALKASPFLIKQAVSKDFKPKSGNFLEVWLKSFYAR